jgi:hypothetical protein
VYRMKNPQTGIFCFLYDEILKFFFHADFRLMGSKSIFKYLAINPKPLGFSLLWNNQAAAGDCPFGLG